MTSLYNDFDKRPSIPPPGINSSRKRIAILMLNSPNIPHYAHYATMNNYMYATKHGYDFIVERAPLNTSDSWTWDPENEYVLVWYKAEFIKRHLKNYHYVLFIDSDATPRDFQYTIEKEVIDRYNDNFSLIFQEDVWRSLAGLPVCKKICTGLICAKNCPSAFAVLDLWARAPYVDKECIEFRYKHAREQDCIMHLFKTRPEVQQHVKIFPAHLGLFGQYDSKWIYHMGGVNKKERTVVLFQDFKKSLDKMIHDTNHFLTDYEKDKK